MCQRTAPAKQGPCKSTTLQTKLQNYKRWRKLTYLADVSAAHVIVSVMCFLMSCYSSALLAKNLLEGRSFSMNGWTTSPRVPMQPNYCTYAANKRSNPLH